MYGLLNTPAAQNYIKTRVVTELKEKLQTNLNIESVYIRPFNVIQLNNVYLHDRQDSVILEANTIYADLELLPLLKKQLVISDAKLAGIDVHLSKDSSASPLNIQFVIDAFRTKKESTKEKIDIKINSINIINGKFRFDVKNKPVDNTKFDPNHIDISNLNAKLALKSLKADSLNIQIKKLGLQEKSGIKINNLITRLITHNNQLSIKGFKLTLPSSILQFDKCEIHYPEILTPADFLDKAIFDIKITSSHIALRDITAFVPAFEHFQDRILFKTEVQGKLDSINIASIALDYGDKMHLTANGYIGNIRQKEKTYLNGSINKLTLSKDGITGILNNFSKEKKETPVLLNNLGALSFSGNVIGYLKDLKAHGNLGSELGVVNADANIGINPDINTSLSFNGKVNTTNFELNKLLNNDDLEKISFDLIASISKFKSGKTEITSKGVIHDFTFKKYTYHNITIDGKYDSQRINGNLSLKDPNIIFNIDGLFDLSEKNPKYNFHARLKDVRPDKLNLSNKYKNAVFGLVVDANFNGKSVDDLQGIIRADSIRFNQSGNEFAMNNFIIEASGEAPNKMLDIKSDIINGKITGTYSFSTIVESIKKTLANYLPSLINSNTQKKNIKENDLNFDLTVNNTQDISNVFKLPVTIYSPSKIIGFYNNKTNLFKLQAFLPSLQTGNYKIQSGLIDLQNTEQNINGSVTGSFITKNGTQNDLSVNIMAKNDTLDILTSFLNKDESKLKGEFSNFIAFSKTSDKTLQTDIHFNPGELTLNNILWKIKDSRIIVKNKDIEVNNFNISNANNEQSLNIDGAYSFKDEKKSLYIDLQKIDLDYIFTILSIDALQFGGIASGKLAVSSIKSKPYAEINLDISDFAFNKATLGHLILNSDLNNETLKVNLNGQLINENDKLTLINGFINPITQELSINFDAQDVNIAFLNKYVGTLFNNVKGKGKGNVHLFGNFSKVTVEGEAFIQDGNIGINLLNTNYTFADSIHLKNNLIFFDKIKFHDEKGNIAQISGKVSHNYFSDFKYSVNLSGDKFMLYNVLQKQNPMIYGTIFGSGTGSIVGDEKKLDINMNLRTEANTNITMDFMETTATEYSFITYKSLKETSGLDSVSSTSHTTTPPDKKTDSGIKMNMNFYIDATPDATVELIMDPIGGDRLKGSGSGALQFVWGTSKDPMLYGTYHISKGSYNFTFQKLFERKFNIKEGGTVQFRGNPFLADIDVTATYRVIANLNDLDKNLVMSTGQTNVPVNCLLHITGALKHPNINMDVELPYADPEVQRQIKSLMGTEDMINRQIVYLLLLSKFYTPNYAVTDQKTSDFAAVASATLSSQLSKILSQIDDRWQIGTNIRTSDSEFSNTEVELILSSRLLNDRVLFNGNFGYRDNLNAPNAFIGDVDIEVLLNRMGTWRLKAYNHYNEKYYYVRNGGSVQTQGLGIMYKRDFDSLKDLFKRPLKIKKGIKIDDVSNDTIVRLDSIHSSIRFVKRDENAN